MGFDVVVDIASVGLVGGWSDFQFGVIFEPHVHPLPQRVLSGFDDVQSFVFLNGPLQLFLDLSLGLAQNILDDGLACNGIGSCGVPTLPATILSLSQTALTVGSSFCHMIKPPSVVAAHTIP